MAAQNPTHTPNPRKRAAPGSSPAVQNAPMPQQYPTSNPPMSESDANFLLRSQAGKNNFTYQDPLGYNMTYGANNGLSQGSSYDQSVSVPAPSTQLARRPINRQLVSTGPRPTFDVTGDQWNQFGAEDSMAEIPGMEENDNIELLEEKANVAKRDAQGKRKQIPPFVQKLSSFLDKSENTDLIRWSDRGDSFIVVDEDEFAKTLIPELFKHNNYASFVRQLNMYGFHKRVGLSDNSMKASERKNKSPSEYYNPYFKRGHPNLLWLINKPKNGASKGKGGNKKLKLEDGEADSDDDGRDGIEEIYRDNMPGASRAISQAPEAGPPQRRDLAVVHNQLSEIQKQQGAITNALTRLRKDHNDLLQQAVGFQTLHDRHENSINAILTFLATVYNRSLDGNVPQNFAQMFNSGIPQQAQNQGNVVELADPATQQQSPGSMSPQRRQQRLLMAPPGRANTISPKPSASPQTQNTPKSGTVEELFEPASDSPRIKVEQTSTPVSQPHNLMMNLINNTNDAASQNNPINGLEFPELLTHYENANGQSPLTSEQRNNMLNLMANSSTSSTNNALLSPTPPPPPSLDDMGLTQAEIDDLMLLQNQQDEKLAEVRNVLPDMDANYFNTVDPNIDLDQYLDPGAFYTGSSPAAGPWDGTFGGVNGEVDGMDFGLDGAADTNGRIVETVVNTPEPGIGDDKADGGSPNKRRRKN
ncbi:Heat shock factor protein [Lachnellula subtilissima]|uniref:Heat shock factor protein n=1 Tax=Lachnellula subtilissima TaxID=602034 RepID=A0A8H8RDA0_9HELO|nr:Heat shock factor protein [Lachnellula subtilissima]